MAVNVVPPAATTLRDIVLRRLDAETKPEDAWSALVLAALDGPEELAKLLDEGDGRSREGRAKSRRREARRARLRSRGKRGGAPANRLPQEHHRRRLPRHRPEGDSRPHARPRPHARRRPQRLRQVELRRGPRAAPHRRDLPLGESKQSLERRLAQPPPPESLDRRRVRARGGEGHVHRRARVGGRSRPRSRHHLGPGPRQAARGEGDARLGDAARRLPSLPLLQRARLDARRGPVEALRRAVEGARPRRPGGRADGAPAGAHHARKCAEGRRQGAKEPPRPARDPERRARHACPGCPRQEGLGPERARGHPGRDRPQAARPTARSKS